MRRDWDCVRQILLKLEEIAGTHSRLQPSDVTGYDEEIVSYHVHLLIDAGLINGRCIQGLGGPLTCIAISLTWEGHEFLDKIRASSMWNSIKGAAKEKGLSLSFDVIKMTATFVIQKMFQ